MQTHLNSCPVCQAEVRELEPVVAALADAAPDRIDEEPWPPGDLEESTLAPILGKSHRAKRRGRRFRWSAVAAAAAICAVVIGLAGLAGFTGPLEPAFSLEPLESLSFDGAAPSVEVEGNLIAHDWGTEIRLLVSETRYGQTYRVTLVSENEERVNAGTFIGIGDKPLRCTFNAALLRKDAARLEVRTPDGELVFFAKLPEKPRVALFGILPWPEPENEPPQGGEQHRGGGDQPGGGGGEDQQPSGGGGHPGDGGGHPEGGGGGQLGGGGGTQPGGRGGTTGATTGGGNGETTGTTRTKKVTCANDGIDNDGDGQIDEDGDCGTGPDPSPREKGSACDQYCQP